MREGQVVRISGKPMEQKPEVFRECWAELKSFKSNEKHGEINAELTNIINFEVRYCKLMEEMWNFKPFHIVFKKNKYEIYDVDFNNKDKKKVDILCKGMI